MPYQYDVDALGNDKCLIKPTKNSSIELLMIGIDLVRNSAKPIIYETKTQEEDYIKAFLRVFVHLCQFLAH